MEVLFAFLKWAASFSQVDEESGSKMDIHNLATVMAPNILYAPPPKQGSKGPIIPQVDESFLAIEAVNSLIKYNENFCEVPEDLQSILTDSALHTASADMSTKEILARYGHIAQGHAQAQKGVAAADVPAQSATTPTKQNGMATRIDQDANQTSALQKQSSARPVNQSHQNNSGHSLSAPQAPYAAKERAGSQSSHEDYGSSNIRSSYQAKPGVPGIAS